MKKITMFVIVGLILVSCTNAKKASEVSAVYIPAETYAGLDCQGLATAADKVKATVPSLESAVNSTQKTDKNKEKISYVSLGLVEKKQVFDEFIPVFNEFE